MTEAIHTHRGHFVIRRVGGTIKIKDTHNADEGRTIANIVGKLPVDYANATLFAAAPDLLEALEALLRVSGLTESAPGYAIREADAKAREAIAKAYGREA